MATQVKTEVESLRKLLKTFHELPPKIKTETRRELRKTGDEIIAAQRAILDGPLPAGVRVAGQRFAPAFNPKTQKFFTRKINVYEDRAIQRPGRSTGLRQGIKEGLVTRVVTGTTRQGIDIRTQNRKGRMSTGWNSKQFRHPVFGRKEWVYQAGQPYFFKPVFEGRKQLIERAIDIISEAVEKS